MQTVEYHIKLPKHLSVRLEDQIIERYGYKARGGITLLIIEAVEEKLNPKKEKNELALSSGDKRVNRYAKVTSDISILVPDILEYATKPNDGSRPVITSKLLKKAIQQRTGQYHPQSVKTRIEMLLNSKVIEICADDDRDHVLTYLVNTDQFQLSSNKEEAILAI